MAPNKYNNLINYLTKKSPNPVTSNELSDVLGVTTRTIRNWIVTINKNNNPLIESNNRGYYITTNSLKTDAEVPSRIISDTTSERRAKIFLELLKNSNKTVNVYDLAEKFYISESTLRSDIKRLREEITTNSLKLYIRQDHIYLEGDEKAKRRHMVSLLYSESTINKKVKNHIENSLDYLSIDEIENDVQDIVLKETNVHLNQYALRNIAIHIIVTIERIKQRNMLSKELNLIDTDQLKKEINIVQKIADKISERYSINFPYDEIVQLSLLFIGYGLRHNKLSRFTTEKIEIEPKVQEKLEYIIKKTEELYLIDLYDESFFYQLLIHVHNLLIRSKYNSYERNSSLIDIKIAYPIIYDISVYIASLIQEEFNINVPEGEISFISLHIGALLEKQELNSEDIIKLMIIADDYQNIREHIHKKIKRSFPSSIRTYSDNIFKEEYYNKFDIIITTNEQLVINYPGTVSINPFILPKDLKKIEDRINQISITRQKDKNNSYIKRYFSEELYYNQINFSDKNVEEIIQLLSQKLIDKNYVKPSYINKLLEREKMAPTSFPSGIAVPHTVELDADATKIVIATLQTPIMWKGHEIKLVALTAINKNEAKIFNEFFQQMIEVTSETLNVDQLSKSNSFGEFINKMSVLLHENID